MDRQTEAEMAALAERLYQSPRREDKLMAGIIYTLMGAAFAGSLDALTAITVQFSEAEVGRLSN